MDAARRERRHHRKAAAASGGVAAAAAAAAGGGAAAAAAAAARAAYGDVFGGPPRFAAPFGGAPLDYAEVFGGVAATCSIPYLDLPPAAAADGFFACAGGKGDYGEIFGRFDFADFALPYEDLFGEPDPEPHMEGQLEEIASSSSGSSRSSIRKECSQPEDESPILPQHQQSLDPHQHFTEHKFSHISFPSDTGSQHFVMSYNKSTERQPDDLVEMTTCVVEPPVDVVFDSRNFSHSQATNHVSRSDNGTMASGNNKNPSSASVSSRSPKSDFIVDQKQQSPSWPPPPISGSFPASETHRNSDSHSSQSNVTPPDYAFLRVTDDDTQTQQIKVQPPLRQKPKLLNKKEIAAKEDINLVNHSCPPTSSTHTTSSSNIPQADKKASSSPTSASAAMKEAMDFAEARLKAAKELLERKGDSFKLRKKSSHRSTRSTEIKVPVPVEVDTSEQNLSVKKPSKEEKNPDDSLSDQHKNLSAVRLDYLDGNGKRVLPLEKSQQMMPSCTESSQSSSTLEKLGNWRSGDEFYELTGDDQQCKTDEGTGEGEKCEQTNPVTSAINDKKSETEFSAADSDLERYEKLWEVNDSRDVGVKHVNPREDSTASVGNENMAHQEVHNSNIEEPVALENAKDSRDADEFVELPSIGNASAKLDFIKDMSSSVPEACSSGNHANDHRDLGNSNPTVSSVAGTSQEDTNSNQVLKVPCDEEMQCTSGIAEKVQEASEVSDVDISWGSNIKSLILEELEESHVFDAFPRGLSGLEPETETYGREKFSFTGESLLHTKDTKINEVLHEEVEKIKIEEKVGPCTHPDETVISLDAEHPGDDNDIALQNDNVVDHEESSMLNIFEVASKLIKRDLDQEMRGSIRRGEVENMEEGTAGLISDNNGKESDETPLKNSERRVTEDGSAHCNQEDQNSSESISRGHINADPNFKTIGDEVRSESFSGDEVIDSANDSTTRTTIISKDEQAKSSEMYAHMQQSMEKDGYATSQLSKMSIPDLEETGEVCNGGRELPAGRSACEENKGSANKMEGKDKTATKLKAEQGPSPFEKSHSPLKSAEGLARDSAAETLKKEELGVRRAKERENITRAESASDKGSSRRTEEAKESDRRLEKERELAKEKERRKLEEEERERERRKDRLAVERATREAHERAFAEAREKAEKMALERITAARQRASAEAREKEERASAEAAAERAAREAKIKADRAAVERATAEARERAIEKAKAEKALADARERRERYRSSLKSNNQDVRQESQFQRATSSNFSRTPDSGNKVVEVESALRHKARLERHQRTAERVTKALAEKNMRDLLAQREQQEKHRLSEFLDPEIKRWSNGKEGNLRALLSTLQYILGSDSGWQPVPLTDLITAAAVKKAYRKATLCVHPDKLQQRGATVRQKYICEKVFDLLKDAWNRFTSEER